MKAMTTDDQTPATHAREWPQRKPKGVLLRLLIAGAVTVLLTEVGLRFLLFSEIPVVASIGRPLRKPNSYASMRDDDLWWKLNTIFAEPGKRRDAAVPEPTIGWVNPSTDPASFAHKSEATVDARRPVLLFGDSYGGCVTGVPCWAQLLQESELSEEMALINYAAGGYGLDQIVLSLSRAIERFEAGKPLVIISLMVDGDLDRANLRYRGWPKSHFALAAQGGLELDSGTLPATSAEYIEQNPPKAFSYLLRWLMYGSGLVEKETAAELLSFNESLKGKQELCRRLIQLAITTCESRQLEYFFVLFNSREGVVWPPQKGWPNEFMVETLEALHAPYVTANSALLDEIQATGLDVDDFFIQEGRSRNHYNERGNRAVFKVIKSGLQGQFPTGKETRALPLWQVRNKNPDGTARMEQGLAPPYSASEDARRLHFGVGPEQPTVVAFKLDGLAAQFHATLKSLSPAPGGSKGRTRLSIKLDGEIAFTGTMSPGEKPQPIDLDLTGVQTMLLVLTRPKGQERGDGLYLAGPEVLWTSGR
ncbi:MAG: hypothetical protein ACI9F9_000035 [Candidatus Paceibacteria bacterium]|jgi:hypothetical protein